MCILNKVLIDIHCIRLIFFLHNKSNFFLPKLIGEHYTLPSGITTGENINKIIENEEEINNN